MRQDEEYAPYEGEPVPLYDLKKMEYGERYKCPFCKEWRAFGLGCATCRVRDKTPKTENEVKRLREWRESICQCGHQRKHHFGDLYGCPECLNEHRSCPCWGFVDKGWTKIRFFDEWHFRRIEVLDALRREKVYCEEKLAGRDGREWTNADVLLIADGVRKRTRGGSK